jgi:tetratricopeptide (TPR) repeat protein
LRKAILAQRKLDTTNTANVDDAARLAMVEACKRPDRPWLAGTVKDAVSLPIASVIALTAVLTPRVHQAISDHREVQYASYSAPADQSSTTSNETTGQQSLAPAQNIAPAQEPAPQAAQQASIAATEPVQQADAGAAASQTNQQASVAPEQPAPQTAQAQTPSQQITVAGPVLAVLNAAAQNDWTAVDLAADNLKDNGASNVAHGDRAGARTANVEGKAALQAQNYASAVEAFRRGVAADPADIELLNNLGYALEESGQQQDAIDAISNVLVRAPRRTAAWANLASSLAESGHLPEAKAAMSVAVHYTGNRDRTLAFLQEQAANGKSDAIRQMSAAVSQQALTIPVAAAAAPKAIPQAQQAPKVAQASHPVGRMQSSEGDEAYVRNMNKQLEQQLKDLGQSK